MIHLLEIGISYSEEYLEKAGYTIKTVDSGEMYAENEEGDIYSLRFDKHGLFKVEDKIDRKELKESFKDKKKRIKLKQAINLEEVSAYAVEYRNMHDAVHYLLIVDERDIAVLIAQGLKEIEEAAAAGNNELKESIELELSNYKSKEKKINFRDIIEENGVRYYPIHEGVIDKEYIEIVNVEVPDIYATDEFFIYEKKRIIMKHISGQGLIEWEEGIAKTYDNKGNLINEHEAALGDLVIEGYIQDSEQTIKIEATLKKKYNKNTKQEEWALISKKDPNKILQWFGTQKPSDEKVEKVEKRVQWFKNKGSINAAFIEIDTVMGENAKEDKKFFDYLKKNNIKHKVVEEAGPAGGWPIVKYTGSKEALMKMIKEKFDDKYLIEEIEGENKGSEIEAKITKERIKKLTESIEVYKERLKEKQRRDYGDININIKTYHIDVPADKIKEKYPNITDEKIDNIYWDLSRDYMEQTVESIEHMYGWEAGVAGRMGGWFYVKGIKDDLNRISEDLDNMLKYDEYDKNDENAYKNYKDEFEKIKKNISAIEKEVADTMKSFKSEVESMEFWDDVFEIKSSIKAYFGIDYTQLQDIPTKILEAFKRSHEGIKAIKDIDVSEIKGDDYPYFEIKDLEKLDRDIQSDIMQWIKSAKFLKVKNNKVSLDTKKIEAKHRKELEEFKVIPKTKSKDEINIGDKVLAPDKEDFIEVEVKNIYRNNEGEDIAVVKNKEGIEDEFTFDELKIKAQVNPMTRDNLERANEIILNGINDIEDILEEVRKSILAIPTEPSKVLMGEYKKIKNAIPKSVDKWKDQIYSIKKLIDDIMRYEDAEQPKAF